MLGFITEDSCQNRSFTGDVVIRLLVEETGVSGENHRLPQVTDKLHHNVVSRILRLCGIRIHNISDDRY